MTVFLLVRHAAHDDVGKFLAGRVAGIHLGEAGRQQALRLAKRLDREQVDAIYTSPRERAKETAHAIASSRSLGEPLVTDDLDEVDFGTWSGKTFEVLNEDPKFRQWNATRSLARTPAGERMMDVQLRILRQIEKAMATIGEGVALFVSHADVIKAAASYYLGLPIDAWGRFEISPASITTLEVTHWGSKLLGLNEVVW